MNLKKTSLWIFLAFILSVLGIFTYFSFEIKKLNQSFVVSTYSKEKGVSYSFSKTKPKNYISLKKLSSKVYGAFVVSEDWAFFDHHGLDIQQIKKAMRDYAKKGKPLRGASTITQQVVKNLFLSSERSFVRKAKEAILALTLDYLLPKEKVLEVYLNIIEFGEGLYGIGNASEFYFSQRASELNPREAAFLAMLLPNPKRYSQSFRERALTDYAEETVGKILFKMKVAKYLTELEYQESRLGYLIFRD